MSFVQWWSERGPKSHVDKEISGRGRKRSREKPGNQGVGDFRFLFVFQLLYFIIFFSILFSPTTPTTHTHDPRHLVTLSVLSSYVNNTTGVSQIICVKCQREVLKFSNWKNSGKNVMRPQETSWQSTTLHDRSAALRILRPSRVLTIDWKKKPALHDPLQPSEERRSHIYIACLLAYIERTRTPLTVASSIPSGFPWCSSVQQCSNQYHFAAGLHMLMLVFLSFLRRALVPRVVNHLSPHPFFSIYMEAIDKPTFKGHSIVTNFRSWFHQRRDKTSVKE